MSTEKKEPQATVDESSCSRATQQAVWTHTTSGQPIECFIVGYEDDEVLLNSPSHGYVIRRRRSEIHKKPVQRQWSH